MTQSEQTAQTNRTAARSRITEVRALISAAGYDNDIDLGLIPTAFAVVPSQKAGSALTTEQYETALRTLGLYEEQVTT